MEKCTAKVNISAAGGTAAKGSRTCKVTLPTTWLESMGISESHRELELSFDGEQITLSRPDAVSDAGHDVRTFRFYDGQRLCTTIRADFTARTVSVENYVADPVKTAFGNNLVSGPVCGSIWRPSAWRNMTLCRLSRKLRAVWLRISSGWRCCHEYLSGIKSENC